MKRTTSQARKIYRFVIILAILLSLAIIFFRADFTSEEKPIYGVTFSKKYALDLELDWQRTYSAILNDLKVSHIRLIAYWNEVEEEQDTFDFTELDWQIQQASNRDVNIVLVVGRRAPRWPECHDPQWLEDLAPLAIQQQQLEYIKTVVERYKDNMAITVWQVENEPLFVWFGRCPRLSKKFLKQEVALVKSLDSRPIIITDSGELGDWQRVSSLADVLGTTMYRIVWNKYLGFWDYFFLPPSVYYYKAEITKFFHKNLSKVIVTELQMEPWTMDQRMVELSLEDQQRSFTLQRFKDNIKYVEKAGFNEIYLWGVEYWYWLDQQGYSEIWEEAKGLW